VPTALITGATAGIGAAFARLLAGEGFDLVLVARDAERLEGVAAELRVSAGVAVDVLPADLVDDGQRRHVELRLADTARPVDVLVNNAGIPAEDGFLTSGVDSEERLLRLNVLAVLRLTKAGVAGMVLRRHGVVVNVSSVAGFLPTGTYSASKAWVTSFTESLAVELTGTGVRTVALCPGFVRTEFHARAGMDVSMIPRGFWLDADDVAAAGWRAVASGRVVVVPSRRYAVVVTAMRCLPTSLLFRVARATRARRG